MKKLTNPRLWIGLRTTKAAIESAKFVFFYGSSFKEQRIFTLSSAHEILEQEEFDNAKPTVVYLHGFLETMEVESISVIANAYLTRNDHNILILDWGELADGSYLLEALPNALKLSGALSDAILQLLNNGLDINKLHIVSHSLGSQLSGLVSRKIQEKSSNPSYKIKRITCLDPAFPLFYPALFFKGISKSDAEFIDVIHTDGWIYGSPFSVGTADFYPNGGTTLQPGCPKRKYLSQTLNDFCSHHRSIRFWAESVANIDTKLYSSKKCFNYTVFKHGWCKTNEVVNMGIDCSSTARGNYYLKTNDKAPFAKELSGTSYQKNYHEINAIDHY
ncbi:unnamed protein product [Diamesa tonsa]